MLPVSLRGSSSSTSSSYGSKHTWLGILTGPWREVKLRPWSTKENGTLDTSLNTTQALERCRISGGSAHPMSFAVECGGAITAVNSSPDDSLCVVGGRELLKIYALPRDAPPIERRNLRVGRRRALDLSTSDARWHPQLEHIIATGSTTGAVLVWDLNKLKGAGAGDLTFRHERSVNRVSWHPSEQSWLLTCSLDATVRLWDARCEPGAAVGGGASSVFSYRYSRRIGEELRGAEPCGRVWRSATGAVRDVQVIAVLRRS
jgi:WD40 repeat protein